MRPWNEADEELTLLQDVRARLHADTADSKREDKIAVEGNLKVAAEGEEVGVQSREES